ncbi:MAG: D-glycero-beta-D-manno-heptose-7-phosphate kinase [Bryobacteraceae bacterium]|jgi:D-beta-D-heptose 7-phosphate kinase/D-beta-D-heptose 1-phosphate adenosyltransferase
MRPDATVARAVEAFLGKRILIIGDLMLDRYWSGTVDRISPEAPVPIVRKLSAFANPGGAANAACNVAALGAGATLFGVVGQDEAGRELQRILSGRGIDCAGISIATSRPTTVKLRIIAHDQQVVRIDDEDTTSIDASLGADVVKRAGRMMPGVDAVLVSDYAKGFLLDGVVKGIISEARRYSKPVIVDPKGADFERYRGATIIKPNRHELGALTGLPVRDHAETVHAAKQLLRLTGSTALVVTEGKDGMTLLRPEIAEEHFPSFARGVYDVTGAGDTAVAMLAVALAAGARLSDAVWLSNLAAGLAVREAGTVAISRDKIAKAIDAMGRRNGKRRPGVGHTP